MRSDSQFPVREPVIRALLALGLSADQIASAIGWSQATVRKDVQMMGGALALFPNRPRKDRDIYAAVWTYWRSKSFEAFGSPMVESVERCLEQLLGLPLIEMYIRGIYSAQNGLTQPKVNAPIGYRRLIAAAVGVKVECKLTPPPIDRVVLVQMLDACPAPCSMTEVLDWLTEHTSGRIDWSRVFLPGPDSLRDEIDAWLANGVAVDSVEREVLVSRFGLSDRQSETLEQIGQRKGRAPQLVYQIECLAVRKFRHAFRRQLNELLEGVESIRRERDGLRKEHEEAKRELVLLRAVVERLERDLPQALPGGPAIPLAILETRVNGLDFSMRTKNCLQNAGIEKIGQLVQCSAANLLRSRGFGRKSLREIEQDVLPSLNLSLGIRLPSQLAARFRIPQRLMG